MKKTKLFFAGAAILIWGGTAVHAQSWRNGGAVSLDKQYADYPCVNLLDSTSVTVEPTGQGSFAVCRAVRVQTTAGALQQRVLKYDYDPLTAAATFKRVTIYHADGTYTSVDVSKACDYAAPARAIYWGARQIMLELGALQPGDIIDYEIDKKGFTYALLSDAPQSGDDSRFIPPMRGQFYDIVPFWSADPTLRKVYRVSLPAEKEMQFQFYQGSCASSMRYEDGRKVYTFAKDAILPFHREPNMVDFYDAAPKLMMSTTADWKEKSRWFYGVNEDYGSFTAIPEAQKKVDELIRGKKTELEKVAVLTHWVADNIRYAGISMGKGEGFTLHNLKMNYTDRCGVCKDIAGTLIAFLRMAGFEAFPAMTMAGSRVETIPADHFNHCVAVVKLSDGTMMPLDPTWVPFCRELWSSAEQQQNYLPGTPEGTDLCLTPISDPENHYVRIKAQNTLDEKGTLKGTFTIEAEGQSDSNIRRIFTTGFQSEWAHTMERQLLNVSPKARLKSVDYGDYVPLRDSGICTERRPGRNGFQTLRAEQPLHASPLLPADRYQPGETGLRLQGRLLPSGGNGRKPETSCRIRMARKGKAGPDGRARCRIHRIHGPKRQPVAGENILAPEEAGLRSIRLGKFPECGEHSQGIWRIYCGKEITTHTRI